MDKIVERGLLYDFYGELLTDHQRRIYEAAVYEDLSPVEISQTTGTSRQAVHDLIQRCTATLLEYEGRLRMIERYHRVMDDVRRLRTLAGRLEGTESADIGADLCALAESIEQDMR